MKSEPYEKEGKVFRYDFDRCEVEYIADADPEMVTKNAEWEEKFGRRLYDIDDSGYMTLDTAGLRKESWTEKEIRDEYLDEWALELDEEASALSSEFIKDEYYTPSSTNRDYSPSNPWDAPGMSLADFI